MCLGAIARLAAVEEQGASPVGVLDDGATVSLAFVPAARPGDRLLLHLGIPVEVLEPETADAALALRAAPPDHGGTG